LLIAISVVLGYAFSFSNLSKSSFFCLSSSYTFFNISLYYLSATSSFKLTWGLDSVSETLGVPSLAPSSAACNYSFIFSAFFLASSASFFAFSTAAFFSNYSALSSAYSLASSAYLIAFSDLACDSYAFFREALAGLLRTADLDASFAASFSLASLTFCNSTGASYYFSSGLFSFSLFM